MNVVVRTAFRRTASVVGALFVTWLVSLANYWIVRIWIDSGINFWVFPLMLIDICIFFWSYDFISGAIKRYGTSRGKPPAER